jgi:hypothetical protein
MVLNAHSTEGGAEPGVLGILQRQLLGPEPRLRLLRQLAAACPAKAVRTVHVTPANLDLVMHVRPLPSRYEQSEANEGYGSCNRLDDKGYATIQGGPGSLMSGLPSECRQRGDANALSVRGSANLSSIALTALSCGARLERWSEAAWPHQSQQELGAVLALLCG